MSWFILIGGVFANAFASVLVKVAVTAPRKFPSLADPMASLTNWPFWLGLSLYGVAFLLYAASLSKFPLHIAHPVLTTGAVAMVAFISVFLFKEQLLWTTALGILLVICGVVLISLRTA